MTDDRERCWTILKAAGAGGVPIFIEIEGEPRSKARPRFAGGKGRRPYSDKKQVAHERTLRILMKAVVRKPLVGTVAIACMFYRSSNRRVDLDNLLKQVLDAGNTILWADDMQVTACVGVLNLDRAQPRTVIVLAPHESTIDRSFEERTCERCQSPFSWRSYPSAGGTGQFCSRTCAGKKRGEDLSAQANCRECGKPFQRRTAAQVLCSEHCRIATMLREKSTRARHPKPWKCVVCGRNVSRPEYRRCRSCFKLGAEDAAGEPGDLRQH